MGGGVEKHKDKDEGEGLRDTPTGTPTGQTRRESINTETITKTIPKQPLIL